MGAQENGPRKQKNRFLKQVYLFLITKFCETLQDFAVDYPFNGKCGKKIFSFNPSLN